MTDIQEKKRTFDVRKFLKKPNKKEMFWAWIAYQSIKGTLTLSFFWIPIFYLWFTK